MLWLMGCSPLVRNETRDLRMTRGLKITRESSDLAGDDAGFFTIYRANGPLEDWLKTAKAELKGPEWSYHVTRPKHIEKDYHMLEQTRDGMKFIVRLADSTPKGGPPHVSIAVTQLVPEERM